MDAADTVISRFKEFFDRSPKGRDYMNEKTTLFPRFDEKTILRLLDQSNMKLQPLGSIIYVYPPVIYIGDVHGNLTDLLRIFHIFGLPPKTKYLFLGDYVDRGSHSIEVISLLFSFSIKYPGSIYLIRGNHEFKSINRNYGFYEEVLNTYGTDEVWQKANEVFGYLPLAAVVGDTVFCVHGGLSPSLNALSAIQAISLPIPLYESNRLIADLVWSDPVGNIKTFEENNRGTGVLYGSEAIASFLRSNKLKLVIRGHQCVANGYSLDCSNMCVTLFSSSNYCRLLQNRCAVIQQDTNRELNFYILQDDSDVNMKPKITMVLATGPQLGLRSTATAQARKHANGIPSGCPPRPPRKSSRPLSLHPGLPNSPVSSSIGSFSTVNTHSGSQTARLSTSSNFNSNVNSSISTSSRLEPHTRYNSIGSIPHFNQPTKLNNKINSNLNLNSNIGTNSSLGSSYSYKPLSVATRSNSSLSLRSSSAIPINSTVTTTSSNISSNISSSIGSSIGSSVGSSIGSSVGLSIGSSVGSSIGSSIGSSNVGSKIGSSIRPPPLNLNMLNLNTGNTGAQIPPAPSSARVMRQKGNSFKVRGAFEL